MRLTGQHRDLAWQRYASTLEKHHLSQEAIEFAEADFKAGYDAALSGMPAPPVPGRRGRRNSRLPAAP